MATKPYQTKEFWTGTAYAGVGAVSLIAARNYEFGSAASMGAGFFPTIVAGLLFLVGAAILLRSLSTTGQAVDAFAWRAIVMVVAATVAFGLLIRTAGLIVALPALIVISAAASREFRFAWRAAAGVVLLVALCAIVFVEGLGVPMPIIGPWLQDSWLLR